MQQNLRRNLSDHSTLVLTIHETEGMGEPEAAKTAGQSRGLPVSKSQTRSRNVTCEIALLPIFINHSGNLRTSPHF
jgi:hypothetical protein